MGHVRLSRAGRARGGYLVGAVIVAAGLYLMYGLGCALVVLGAAVALYALFIYDVDEPPKAVLESQLGPRRPPSGGDDW